MREKVDLLEGEMLALPQVDCPVRNYFAPGVYAREITIPAGVCLVGVEHKTDNLVVLSAGRLLLSTEAGPVEIEAPHTLMCKAGSKNAAVAIETAVWTNFFPNPDNETNVDKLVEVFTYAKASDLLGGTTNRQLSANNAAKLKEEAKCLSEQ